MKDEIFNGLIKALSVEAEGEESFCATFEIDPSSEVFEGHFPGQPVLPGVVMVEIAKRSAERALQKDLKMVEAANFKFLRMIDPTVVSSALFRFALKPHEHGWRVKGTILSGEDIYFKADAVYREK